MEILTIKEIAPYLPYGLKVSHTTYFENGDTKNAIVNLESLHKECVTFSDGMDYYFDDPIDNECTIKPILRHLSSLTQHEMNVLRSMRFRECYQWTKTQYNYIKEVKSFPTLQKYDVVEYLFKNHFDVFKLIDRGLALPIDGKEVEGE